MFGRIRQYQMHRSFLACQPWPVCAVLATGGSARPWEMFCWTCLAGLASKGSFFLLISADLKIFIVRRRNETTVQPPWALSDYRKDSDRYDRYYPVSWRVSTLSFSSISKPCVHYQKSGSHYRMMPLASHPTRALPCGRHVCAASTPAAFRAETKQEPSREKTLG